MNSILRKKKKPRSFSSLETKEFTKPKQLDIKKDFAISIGKKNPHAFVVDWQLSGQTM